MAIAPTTSCFVTLEVGMISRLVCIDVPDRYRSLACWAVQCLLEPLGVTPKFHGDRSAASTIYYGPQSETANADVTLAFSPTAARMFEDWDSYTLRQVTWREWEGERWPVFFSGEESLPDLVASAALILSGWQEVTTRARDEHGRFRFADSLQDQLGFAQRPVVDAYREWLNEQLVRSGLESKRRRWGRFEWATCVTIDIDYARKWRPGMVYREVVDHLLLNERRVRPVERLKRFGTFVSDAARRGDVYRESLDHILMAMSSRGANATLFVKAGAHGRNDVAYSLGDKQLRERLERAVRNGNEIGVHPSYYASAHAGYMAEERDAVGAFLNTLPDVVRQHYLRYELPVTLRLHEALGFRIDSSLGFAEHEGFRRGTCLPFRIFDLHANRTTDTWEMPLLVMDGTLFNRRGYSVDEAIEATHSIMNFCKRFGGCCVMLWHEVIRDQMDAPGWDQHFDETLDYAIRQEALVTSLSEALDAWSSST